MATEHTTHTVCVNNATVHVDIAGDPAIKPRRLFDDTPFHPGSYALFTDRFADADGDAPAAFDERIGDRIYPQDTVDLSEHQQLIAILKRNL